MASSEASLQTKVLPLGALVLTTAVSVTLLATRSHTYNGTLVSTVQNYRSTVQVLVHAVAAPLSLMQVYVLKALFNFSNRLRIVHEGVSLSEIALWVAISRSSVDWSLPKKHLHWLSLVVVAAAIPQFMWIGALTPVKVSHTRHGAEMEIPAFNLSTNAAWKTEFSHDSEDVISNEVDRCTSVYDKRGFIPSCPVPALQGQLLLSAATATTSDDSMVRQHSRLDTPEWSYYGRSYGVGASVSLASLSEKSFVSDLNYADDLNYTFEETGYNSKVDCFRNTSSELQFELRPDSPSDFPIYTLQGALSNAPNGVTEDYPVVTWYYNRLLGWKARSYNNRNVIAIASGEDNYTDFHHIDCEVEFVPTLFRVSVYNAPGNIAVTPLRNSTTDIESSGTLIASVIQSINLLSRMSNSYYISVRGEALKQNLINMRLRTAIDNEDSIMAAVSESFTAMIDDILVAYGASQMANAEFPPNTTSTPAEVQYPVIQIGNPRYIYIVFALNTAIVLIALEEVIRQRFWDRLLKFDYANVKCSIFAASAGGDWIAESILDANSQKGGNWDGDPSNEEFAIVKVKLAVDDGRPRFFAAPYADIASPEQRHVYPHSRKRSSFFEMGPVSPKGGFISHGDYYNLSDLE